MFSYYRCTAVALCTCALLSNVEAAPVPTFNSTASVHDPSIVQDGNRYYVFGSHLASAWSDDLMNWHQISTAVVPGNPLFPDAATDLADVLEWSSTDTLWAPDVYQLPDGTWAFYYCASQGDAPRASLGLAYSDDILGPYEDQGVMLQSGMWGQISPDGTVYDATVHPNAVDPALFNDPNDGLWMVYGSYSGGIFIMEMNPQTGWPLPGQGYGTKVMGGNHARIEGAFIAYNPDTQYYYLFVSYGGLAADGGYNIRVARSQDPDGPYLDAAGQDMINAKGAAGTTFDDDSIAPYGVKLMGNAQFLSADGEPYSTSTGYVSPGHNSVLHDATTGKWFNIFHSRFVGRGEEHEVRVHQMFFNDADWPVVAPHRYAGETIGTYTEAELAGDYKVIHHGKDITATVKTSTEVSLNGDGTVTGASTGTWQLDGAHDLQITLGGTTYTGVFCRTWDTDNRLWVDSFTALSADGTALWGSEVAIPERSEPYTPIDLAPIPAQALAIGETLETTLYDRQDATQYVLEYELIDAPAGAAIGAQTGVLTYTPLLDQMGQTVTIRARAYDVLDPSLNAEVAFTVYVGAPQGTLQGANTFDAVATTGIEDADGDPTGLTARLSGTGTALAEQDPKLNLDTAQGVLEIESSQADFNGQAGVAEVSAPGRNLSDFGFTGTQDFVVQAEFGPVQDLAFIDQVGLYVGTSATTATRAGVIVFDAPQAYSAHTQAGTDVGGHFTTVVDPTDGLTVIIARQDGVWYYFVDGVPTHPTTGEADFLDTASDLTVGAFIITPLNADVKTAPLQSLTYQVGAGASSTTDWAQWVLLHFGANPLPEVAGPNADPDHDLRPNLMEYAVGSDPLVWDHAALLATGLVDGHVQLSFDQQADPALRYAVEATSDLTSADWQTIWSSAGEDNTDTEVTVTDSASATGDTPRFLRLRVDSVE